MSFTSVRFTPANSWRQCLVNRVTFVDLQRQTLILKPDLLRAMEAVRDRADFIMGDAVAEFDAEFASFCGKRCCVSLNSGTDPLEFALRAHGIHDGEVITAQNSYFSTAMVISKVGAKPVFVDVKADSFNLDPSRLEAAISKATRAIIPVHLCGQPVDLGPIHDVARRRGIVVIVDWDTVPSLSTAPPVSVRAGAMLTFADVISPPPKTHGDGIATFPVDVQAPPGKAPATTAQNAVLTSALRIPALDGLRGVAIALVLVYHTVFRLRAHVGRGLATLLATARLTWTGVDLFFVLSGFLIGGILLDAVGSRFYFRTFYLRRAYRILPLYLVLMGLFALRFVPGLGSVGPLGKLTESRVPFLSYLTFTQNIWMALLGTAGVGTMAMTWSLAIEEQFYLTVPFFIRKVERSRLPLILLAVVIGAPILRTLLLLVPERGRFAAFLLMPCRADGLCLGVLCALIARTPRWWGGLLARRAILRGVAGVLLVGMVVLTVLDSAPRSTLMVTIGYSWIALFYSSCLLLAVTASGGPLHRLLTNPTLMGLGTLAYFTYLAHLPIVEFCRRAVALRFPAPSLVAELGAYAMSVTLTLGLARLSWRFFEQPLLRRAHVYRY